MKKLLSIITIMAVALTFSFTPLSSIWNGEGLEVYAAKTSSTSTKSSSTKSTSTSKSSTSTSKSSTSTSKSSTSTSKSSTSTSKSSTSTSKSSTSTSKSSTSTSKSSTSTSKSSTSTSKSSTSTSKSSTTSGSSSTAYTVADASNSKGMESPTGKSYSEMVSTYGKGNVVVGADGYLHGSYEGAEKAASYDGGAQYTPATKDQLQTSETKGSYTYTLDVPANKGEVYQVGGNSKVDAQLAAGLYNAGYLSSKDASVVEITAALGQWKSDGQGIGTNTYVSTLGYTNVQSLISMGEAGNGSGDTSGLSGSNSSDKSGSSGNGSGRSIKWQDEDGITELGTCSVISYEITSKPLDGKSYLPDEKISYEISFNCTNVNDYDGSKLLKELYIDDGSSYKAACRTPEINKDKGIITFRSDLDISNLKAGKHELIFMDYTGNEIGKKTFTSDVAVIDYVDIKLSHSDSYEKKISAWNKKYPKFKIEDKTYMPDEALEFSVYFDVKNYDRADKSKLPQRAYIKEIGKTTKPYSTKFDEEKISESRIAMESSLSLSGVATGTYTLVILDKSENVIAECKFDIKKPEIHYISSKLYHTDAFEEKRVSWNSKYPKYKRESNVYWPEEALKFECELVCIDFDKADEKKLLKRVYIAERGRKLQPYTTDFDTTKPNENRMSISGTLPLEKLQEDTYTLCFEDGYEKELDKIKFISAMDEMPRMAADYPKLGHTDKWEKNRRSFNEKVESKLQRSVNVYWIGEKVKVQLRYKVKSTEEYIDEGIATECTMTKRGQKAALYRFKLNDPKADGEKALKQVTSLYDKSFGKRLRDGEYILDFYNSKGEKICESVSIVFDDTINYYDIHMAG